MPGLPGGLIPTPSELGASHGAHGHRPQAVLPDWAIPHRPSPHRLLPLEHVRRRMPPGVQELPPRAGGHLRKGAVLCHQIRRNRLPFGARPSRPRCDPRVLVQDGARVQQRLRPPEKNTPEGAIHGAEPSPWQRPPQCEAPCRNLALPKPLWRRGQTPGALPRRALPPRIRASSPRADTLEDPVIRAPLGASPPLRWPHRSGAKRSRLKESWRPSFTDYFAALTVTLSPSFNLRETASKGPRTTLGSSKDDKLDPMLINRSS